MDPDTYVEEEHWNLVTTLAHMLRSIGHRMTCGTLLEEECLALKKEVGRVESQALYLGA